MVRDESQTIAKRLENRRIICVGQARCGFDQRIKHPLHIDGRPTYDLQDVRGRRLLFEAFC
jgi:hypothetical protein